MPKLTIVVSPDLCIGAASCVTVSPEFFVLNEKNKAEVLDHGVNGGRYERTVLVSEEEKDQILLAAESCPTQAITILDENGIQLFPR